MKVDPGYYKVEIKDGFFRTRYHYLRVYYGKDKKKYLQLDHGIPELAENTEERFIENYIIVKKITKPIEINKLHVNVKWTDEDGHEFEMGARNSYALDRIFELFPRLKKVFFVKQEQD